jgi:hypothetical protein
MLVLTRPKQSVRPLEATGRTRHLLRRGRNREPFPALGAPALQDVPPPGCLHPRAEAMHALPANPARLIRPLHRKSNGRRAEGSRLGSGGGDTSRASEPVSTLQAANFLRASGDITPITPIRKLCA